MVSDSTCNVSNQMKPHAALGFRVKSGWAAAVLLKGSARSPKLCDVQRIDLSDPRFPETRQPYHAAMGRLETDTETINRRVDVVRRIAEESIAKLLAGYRQQSFRIKRAALVVGSQIDPRSVANAHIRAHALEDSYFGLCSRNLCRHTISERTFLSNGRLTAKPPWNSNDRM